MPETFPFQTSRKKSKKGLEFGIILDEENLSERQITRLINIFWNAFRDSKTLSFSRMNKLCVIVLQ